MLQLEWIEYPTLRFVMGSDVRLGDQGDDEGPSRDVTVGRFLATRTPVTVGQFAEFVDQTGFETTAEYEGSGFIGTFPQHELVSGSTWRLPLGSIGPEALPESYVSQVSWADARAFCAWSETLLPSEAQWARMATDRANQFEPRIGSWWEWCEDYYDATFYRGEQRVNPTGPFHGTHRVARGGSERRTKRESFFPDLSATDVTFRAVKTQTGPA